MDQQTPQTEVIERNILREIIINFRRSIILMLVVVFLSLGTGFAYAKLRKPEYIAEEQVLFSMGDGTFIQAEINAMHAYRDTVVDFCDNGVVLDRANYYYSNFLALKGGDYSLDQYIESIEYTEDMINWYEQEIDFLTEKQLKEDFLEKGGVDANLTEATLKEISVLRQCAFLIEAITNCNQNIYNATRNNNFNAEEVAEWESQIKKYKEYLIKVKRGDNVAFGGLDSDLFTIEQLQQEIEKLKQTSVVYYDYNLLKENNISIDKSGILAERIGIKEYTNEANEEAFVFGVTYEDVTSEEAIEKVRILVLAFDLSSLDFFDDMNTRIDDLGTNACTVDITTSKIMLIALCLGLVLAVLIVYVQNLFDKTVKDKALAEKLVGAPMLSCIHKQEDAE